MLLLEYMVLPEQDGMRLRDVLRRVMGVSYTAMKSAKWNGGITVDGVVTPVDCARRTGGGNPLPGERPGVRGQAV